MNLRSEGKALSPTYLIFFSAFSALASYKGDKDTKEDKHFCLRGTLAPSPSNPQLRPAVSAGRRKTTPVFIVKAGSGLNYRVT